MNGESNNTFLNYIKNHFDEPIHDYVEKWLKDHLKEMGFFPVDKKHIKLKKLEFCSVRIADRGGLKIGFDLSIRVTARALLHDLFDPTCMFETDIENKWFNMTFNADLNDDLSNIYILSFRSYEPPKRSKHNPVNGDLLPSMFEVKDYEKFAIDFIRKNVDPDYDGSYVIPIIDLIKKCGLEVWDYSFAGRRKPYGRIFFVDSEFECYDKETKKLITTGVNANTICVDVDKNTLESKHKDSVTLAHEFSHYMLHRKAFFFQRLIQDDLVEFAEFDRGGMEAKGFDKAIIEKMEIQASIMAPILLMPKKALIEYTNSIYNDHIVIGGKDDVLLFVEDIIREVAKHFHVTQYAARKRLKECGFFQKVEAMVWLDGGYIKPFAFAKGTLAYDETFILSSKQLAQVYENPYIRKHLKNSNYLFVENHLILNSPKYITINSAGELVLTKFARHNADKCCLKFKLVNDSNKELNPLIIDSLFRDASKSLTFNLTMATNDALKSKYNQDAFKRHLENCREVKAKLCEIDNYQDAIYFLLDHQGMSQSELARDSGVSESSIKRYLRKTGDKSKPTKKAAMRLCLGFRLPKDIALQFCELCDVTFNPRNEDDEACLLVLETMSGQRIEKIEKVLTNLDKFYVIDIVNNRVTA